jgi:hypothetical protein
MSELKIEQPFNVVMDLFSNCSHRYRQFDGTQSLPYKEGGALPYAGTGRGLRLGYLLENCEIFGAGTFVRTKHRKSDSATTAALHFHALLQPAVSLYKSELGWIR